jgi:diguanylate cyclase (GGDEF)-like protein/PAS domain S-box-containing protein
MASLLQSGNQTYQPASRSAAKLLFVALAYFVSGRLGLAIPYVGSHITLIWLPTGIAVAALMRWGYICWPGIFLGALATNFSIDASPLLDSSIAVGNTLAPLLAAWMLRRWKFHDELDRAYDILLLVLAAAFGMLVSASGGVSSLVLYKVLPVQDAGAAWLSWWAGDFVGVLLAAPLLLNISRDELKILWAQRVEFSAWFMTTFVIYGGLFLFSSDELSYSHQLAFIGLPTVVWAAMRFGVVGSSLGVLLSVFITVLGTGRGLGPFYNGEAQQELIQLGAFFFTLVLVNLMVVALQAGRKRAEEAVRLDSEFNKGLIQSLPGIFYMIDISGRFLMWNRQLESVLQLSGDEIARSNPLDFFEGDDRTLIEANIRKTFETGETVTEAVLVIKSGARMNYHFTGHRIERHGAQVLVGVGIDITDRQRIQMGTDALLRRNQVLMKTAIDGIHILDVDGNVIEANDAFCRLLGYTQEEVVHLNVADWDRRWSREELRQRTKNFIEERAQGTFETMHRRKDGTLVDVEVSCTGVVIEGEHYLFAASRDISERRRIQKETESLLKRYQTLMKNALDGFRVIDMQGNIVEANDAFCRMLGYTHEEALKLNIADWDAQWSKEELLGRLKGFIGKSGATFETLQRRKDGTMINVEVSTTGVELEGQNYFFAASRDITGRKLAEKTLQLAQVREAEALRELRVMLNISGEGFWKADLSGYIVDVNDAYCDLVGYPRDEIVGSHVTKFEAIESTPEMVAKRIHRIIEQGTDRFETRHRHRDGHQIDIEIVASFIRETDSLIVFIRNVSERKQIEEVLRIAAITFDTQEGIMITGADGNILRVNQAFQEITGYSEADVIGQNPRMFQSGRHDAVFFQDMWSALLDQGKWSGEIWDKRKDGEIYPKAMTITAVYDDKHQISHYVAVFGDISDRKKSEQEIHRLAYYDSLTMLPNRRLLLDRLKQVLAVSARNGRHGALLFLDMDHFKTINDTQGHAMGDQLLIEVSRRLQASVREGDSVSRLGGDEFVVVLEDLDSDVKEAASQTETVAEKIRLELDKPFLLNEFECLSSVSIGISLFRGHQESAESLLQHADVAMYQAKMAGRNAIRFFDPQMQTALDMRASMEADLRHALEKQQFLLHYQIQVDSLRRPLGAEVLIRWDHPERGLVSPMQFIPLAEETGLIVPIGLWVLQTACAQLKSWQNSALTRDLTLAVNVSAKQFRQADFVAQVNRLLLESGAKHSHLKLELTESTVLENVEDTIHKMRELKLLGVSFSLDDFGTGYSSLQYLKRLPLDQIKIDQSFVRDIVSDPNDAAIVQTIIAMTEALGLHVIAEGVETEEQNVFLDKHGCHAFQGYLFSKPVPLEQFKALLDKG